MFIVEITLDGLEDLEVGKQGSVQWSEKVGFQGLFGSREIRLEIIGIELGV